MSDDSEAFDVQGVSVLGSTGLKMKLSLAMSWRCRGT